MQTANIDTIQGHVNYLINQWVNTYEYYLEALKLFSERWNNQSHKKRQLISN